MNLRSAGRFWLQIVWQGPALRGMQRQRLRQRHGLLPGYVSLVTAHTPQSSTSVRRLPKRLRPQQRRAALVGSDCQLASIQSAACDAWTGHEQCVDCQTINEDKLRPMTVAEILESASDFGAVCPTSTNRGGVQMRPLSCDHLRREQCVSTLGTCSTEISSPDCSHLTRLLLRKLALFLCRRSCVSRAIDTTQIELELTVSLAQRPQCLIEYGGTTAPDHQGARAGAAAAWP